MRSVKLAKAINTGKVLVRTGRGVTGQVLIKFRTPGVQDRLLTPYVLADQNKVESFLNLSKFFSAEQIMTSNLEELVNRGDIELG